MEKINTKRLFKNKQISVSSIMKERLAGEGTRERGHPNAVHDVALHPTRKSTAFKDIFGTSGENVM